MDLSLSDYSMLLYTGGAVAEDRATLGSDPSAATVMQHADGDLCVAVRL